MGWGEEFPERMSIEGLVCAVFKIALWRRYASNQLSLLATAFFLLDLFGVWTLASGHAVLTLNPEP